MTELRRRLKSFVWMALIAICGIALGPTVSRALLTGTGAASAAAAMHGHASAETAAAPVHHEHVHAMAGAHDAMSMPMPEAHAAGGAGGTAHSGCELDCCPLCAVAALPFAGMAWLAPAGVAPERSALRADAEACAMPRRRALWSSASPRGPPRLS